MKKFRNGTFYILVVAVFSVLIFLTLKNGKTLETGREIVENTQAKGQLQDFVDSFHNNLSHPLALLLLQIISIIFVARLFGWICKRIGQPTVIGEMVAGIVLGPSLLGMLFP